MKSRAVLVGGIALTVAVAACGSAPSEDAAGADALGLSGEQPRPDRPIAANARAMEALRVQQLLDARYAAGDVRHSFQAKWGDDIDCIDFFAQPGVKWLAAHGQPLTEIPDAPEAAPIAANDGPDDMLFRGEPDANGRTRACPKGTVPEIRMTAQRIQRAGGIDRYLTALTTKRSPPRPKQTGASLPGVSSLSDDHAGYAHVVGTIAGSAITSATSITTIWKPFLTTSGDHTLSQTWLYTGTLAVDDPGGCKVGATCIETIEAGWTVDPALNGDLAPHLFTFATPDGYASGTYNGLSSELVATLDGGSAVVAGVPWVHLSTQLAMGAPLTPSVGYGTQHVLNLTTAFVGGSKAGWYVHATQDGAVDTWLGYYPAAGFSLLAKGSATTFQMGGEVAQSNDSWTEPMGTGLKAVNGYAAAADHHGIVDVDNGNNTHLPVNVVITAAGNAQIPYTVVYPYSTNPPKGPTWGSASFFYFGGQSATCEPQTSCGVFAAQCGTVDNGCGGTISCGSCSGTDTCNGNTCIHHVTPPPTCGKTPTGKCSAGWKCCGSDGWSCGVCT